MADFDAVLRKAIYGLPDPTPELRQKVYQKARSTVAAKLAAVSPPPPVAVAERQKKALEDAIERLEAEFRPAMPPQDEDGSDELESIFARLEAETKADAAIAPPKMSSALSVGEPKAEKPETSGVSETPGWLSSKPEPRPIAPRMSEMQDRGVAASGGDDRSNEPHGTSLFSHEQPVGDEFEANPQEAAGTRAAPGPRQRSGLVRLAAAAVVFLVLFGAGYGIWLNRSEFASMFGLSSARVAETATAPVTETAADLPEEEAADEAAPTEEEQAALPAVREAPASAAAPEQPAAPATPAATERVPKFTQRLNADGSEIDAGPAGGEPSIGEGTTIAAVTSPPPQAPSAPAAEAEPEESPAQAAPAESGAVPVGQRAIFYEERTSAAQGSAEGGSIVWSVVQEPPAADAPPEPAIRGEATIPGKDLQLRMTIRRNGDETLPASHIIEMIFLTPDNFAGGGIDNVLRMTMKDTEQATGNPLLGIPAKIADGFFLIALSDGVAEIEANTTLLRRQNWIDIPVVYRSGRRALITMEKGVPGERVFEEVMRAWQNASSG